MSKVLKKERKQRRQLEIQRRTVQRLENLMIECVDPVICPVKHHFTKNKEPGLNTYCREFFAPAGTVITGTVYKIETFWVLATGKMRLVEGDHTKEIEGPCLMKNAVGVKNAGYAHTDCLLYGITPNPSGGDSVEDAINVFSVLDAKKIQGMGENEQELNFAKRQQLKLVSANE
jgi:hypothetical protein